MSSGEKLPRFMLLKLLLAGSVCLAGSACGVRSNLPSGQSAYSVIPVEPVSQAPTSYLIGPMDTISVSVFREPELSVESMQVDPTGNIVIPLLGTIQAKGSSPEGLSRIIEAGLLRYVHDPRVAITVQQTGRTIVVEGAVNKPGVYPITGRSSLIEALALAGSPSQYADNDQIFVFREIDGQQAGARFDIRRIRAGLDPDPAILPGDLVVVNLSGVKEAWRDYVSIPVFNAFRSFDVVTRF